MTQRETLDTEPWYKQFWPWFIIALPLSAVIAGITTVVIAYKNADSLVVDDYYNEGKAINMRTNLLKKAQELDYKATLSRLEENKLQLTFDTTKPTHVEIKLDWVHPTDSEKDFSLLLKRQLDGRYIGQSEHATAGRWYIRVSIPDQWLMKSESNANAQNIRFVPDVL